LEQHTFRQIEGLITLVRDATVAAADGIEVAHSDTARTPYAILQQIPVVRKPAGAIAQVHFGITSVVYRSIRALTHLSAGLAVHAVTAAERRTAAK
jgi:hypothetical protein